MFLWIRDQKWLPAALVGAVSFLILGGLDLWLQGTPTLLASFVLASSIAFSRALPWLSISLFSIGLFIPLVNGLEPQLSQLAATLALFVLAAFSSKWERLVAFVLNVALGTTVYFWNVFQLPVGGSIYGIELPTGDAKIAISVAGFVALLAITANAWFIGRLIYTQLNHVGTSVDVALMETRLASAELALAEQDRRFGIAKDVTDLLLDQTSANLVLAESGGYALKSDPTVASRVVENLHSGIKTSFHEIRRLSDLLGLQDRKALALPGLRDLNALYISYREFGFGVNFRETGTPLSLNDGISLVIYRIVFDSLDNVRKHAPINTGVDIDFIWKDKALQILIKDNGEEVSRAMAAEPNEYGVLEDQKALVEHLTGPGLTAMAERVVLFEGNIEFTRVPGVGFTVSAAFPNVAKYSKGN
ncbi:MAG: hypothetical protein EBZ61_04235 [Micrococcales bacterium]|nr:hypothetical protein [Micrococcales bacterium]